MAYTYDPDLIDRIAAHNGVSRASARRILIDLIDHHKRKNLKKHHSGSRAHTKHVFKPPISSVTTKKTPFDLERRVHSDPNPHSRTRISDLESVSNVNLSPNEVQRIKNMIPKISRQQTSRGRGRAHTTYQRSANLVFDYAGSEITINKHSFIITCHQHGMPKPEIKDFIMPFIPQKPEEDEKRYHKRVYAQIHTAVLQYETTYRPVDKTTEP